MNDAKVCGKEISYGPQRWKVDSEGRWQVLMYGSHGPNDPPIGLSWKWHYIAESKVPDDVKALR